LYATAIGKNQYKWQQPAIKLFVFLISTYRFFSSDGQLHLKVGCQERLEEYKRLHTIGKVFGIESFVLSREETKQLYPLMNVSDIYGTLYSPRQVPTFAS
jgi:hypothetical protein